MIFDTVLGVAPVNLPCREGMVLGAGVTCWLLMVLLLPTTVENWLSLLQGGRTDHWRRPSASTLPAQYTGVQSAYSRYRCGQRHSAARNGTASASNGGHCAEAAGVQCRPLPAPAPSPTPAQL